MPALQRELLAQHSAYSADGVTERAFYLDQRGSRLLAIAYTPDGGRASDLGFVVAHSFGLEVLTLRRAERTISRALAAAGHPVLFLHRRGFGDSEGEPEDVTIEGQLDDLRLARDHLSVDMSAGRIGFVGCRFGGLLAGHLGAGEGADALVLVQPPLDGARWVRSFIREMHVVTLADRGGSARGSLSDLRERMERDGMLDVLGYALPRVMAEEAERIDLRNDLAGYTGSVLLVQVAKRPSATGEYAELPARIAAAGGRCELRILREPAGSTFGSASFVQTTANDTVRTDVMHPLIGELSSVVSEWAT